MNSPAAALSNTPATAGRAPSDSWRAFAAAAILIVMTAGSTATSSLFVAYKARWGITSADIAIVFSAYVGTLLPVLLLFGGLADRFGRRRVMRIGILLMATGLTVLTLAHDLHMLILARLFQGAGVGLSVGAVTAAFSESYRGKIPAGNAIGAIAAIGLAAGPVVSAISFNLGGGLNLSYLPALVAAIGLLVLTPAIANRAPAPNESLASDEPHAPQVVRRALVFALPLIFISWAGLSLYLSLVPSYLAASLHVANPLIGATAVIASQVSSLIATLRLGQIAPERSGIVAPLVMLAGLVLLLIGTNANVWPFVALATVMVGAGGGVAAAAAFGIAGRVLRGQRTRVYARMYVAAYLGYSLPSLAIGMIALHYSLAAGFTTVIVVLAFIAASLPLLRERPQKANVGRAAIPVAA